jgi:hypothetical protein
MESWVYFEKRSERYWEGRREAKFSFFSDGIEDKRDFFGCFFWRLSARSWVTLAKGIKV